MPRLKKIREVFSGLGCKSPPDWVERLEAASGPVFNPASQQQKRPLFQEPEENHLPFGKWWVKWFKLDSPPSWMEKFSAWFYTTTTREFFEEEIAKKSPSSEGGSLILEIPARKDALAVARRVPENWPSRKKVIFVPGNKDHYQSKSDWFTGAWGQKKCRQNGYFVTTQVTGKRVWDPNLRKKVLGEPKTRTILTLAGEVEFQVPQIQQKIIPVKKPGNVHLYDFIDGSKVYLGTEYCSSGQDFALALREQREKLLGIDCTPGCKRPKWMKNNQWKKVQASALFAYLNTDWTSKTGCENPDLVAKFSGLDLSAPAPQRAGEAKPENKKTAVNFEPAHKARARARRQNSKKFKKGGMPWDRT